MGGTERPDWAGRIDKTWRALDTQPCAFVVSTPTNLYYLCGFDGSQGYLVLTPTERWLLIDGRYLFAAESARAVGSLGPVSVVGVEGGFDKTLAALLDSLPAGDIAFEAERVTVAAHLEWQRRIPTRTFHPTLGLVERSRLVKDAVELAIMRRGCRQLSDVARHLREWVAEGRTEREVGADIQYTLVARRFFGPGVPADRRVWSEQRVAARTADRSTDS